MGEFGFVCVGLGCFWLVWFGLGWFGLVWFGLIWIWLVWFGLLVLILKLAMVFRFVQELNEIVMVHEIASFSKLSNFLYFQINHTYQE